MPLTHLRAGYVLRLTQHLSRLRFELRDVRTGRSHHFDSTTELSRFLDDTVSQATHDRTPEGQQTTASPGGPST